MAHEVENMFTVGQKAWHGLGVTLEEPPTVDDAIIHAGLNWNVGLEDMFLADGRQVPDRRAVVRNTDLSVLGTVGNGFTPLQNIEAFRWFQPFIDQGLVTLEAAGSLRGGSRVWVLAKNVAGQYEVVAGDPVEQYVLLAHGHDGSLAARLGFTAVRVVCNNTLQASLSSSASKLITIRHTSGMQMALEKVRDVMNLATSEFEATVEQLRFLASKGCTDATLKRYVREVFAPGTEDDATRGKRILDRIIPLFDDGIGAEFSRGTWWGAYNSVTQFLTHHRGTSAEVRLDSEWFGEGSKLTAQALTLAVEMAEAS